MTNKSFIPVHGTIQTIKPVKSDCCQLLVSVNTNQGIVTLVIAPETFVIKDVTLKVGMQIAAFYDGNVPVPLIYPPQYTAVAIGRKVLNEEIIMDYFDENLVGSNNSLKLNVNRSTRVFTSNGQPFSCSVKNRVLIVYYQTTTKSIPPQTTPNKIIVIC